MRHPLQTADEVHELAMTCQPHVQRSTAKLNGAWLQSADGAASTPKLLQNTIVGKRCLAVVLKPRMEMSQRSFQDAPIFRLLLKVAVRGTHQCDS